MGIIDFDFVRPAPRLHDIAYALQYVAPFRDDDECTRRLRSPQPPDRRGRPEQFCSAYGLTSTDGIVDAVVAEQRATADRVRRLAEAGHEPQATWAAEGYLRELEHRTEWSRAHRYLFEWQTVSHPLMAEGWEGPGEGTSSLVRASFVLRLDIPGVLWKRVAMTANDPTKLETTLADGRRMTLSLPPTDAGWAADGIKALRVVPPTHTGRGQEPPALPERPALPLEVALLGLGA